ncbi:MAG: thiol protease/hemagglutinin PrtT [Bacteroidales bacterium]|nr:thiol protease/hemagglutinin PrtT [Bacteroidales bacterium]
MKHSYLIILLCLSTLTLTASPVTPEEGLTAATHFMKSQLGTAPIAMQLVQTGQSRSRGVLTDCYYIYNVENGFVIVSADTRVRPILGYSTEGVFNPADVPFGMQELLDSYTDEIEAIVANVAEPDAQLQAQWQALMDGSYEPQRGGRSVSALLDNETGINNWQQNNGYNYYCPADASGPGGHCYVGCCALSMGQIIHYWEYPTQGTGSHSYECNHSTSLNGQYGDYGTLSVNFGNTTYNYAIMPNNLNSSTPSNQILAIAKLLYHCGVSIEMWYGNQGSMGFHTDIANALETYFGYDECMTVWKDSYSGDWANLLKSDLDLGRPIIYCAYASEGGHEFVCDGYDDSDYFHFNMGWGGVYNGYYAIDNLNAQYNFSNSHGAVTHIRPRQNDIGENSIATAAHPNPATSIVTVEAGNPILKVTVYDLAGRVVMAVDGENERSASVKVTSLPDGIYLLSIVTVGGVETVRLVKQ